MAATGVRTCSKCGTEINNEQLRNHAAVKYKGDLLCPGCAEDLKSRILAAKQREGDSTETAQPPEEEVPIALVELDKPRVVAGPSTQIHQFSGPAVAQHKDHEWKRALLKGSPSATRCKTFHCKLTDASMQNMNEQVNEWVDGQEDVEIKFAISNIGVVEGKHADPHLILTVFY